MAWIFGTWSMERSIEMENEQENINIEPLKYQLRQWHKEVTIKHLPPTNCDRDNPIAISEKITLLEERIKDLTNKTHNGTQMKIPVGSQLIQRYSYRIPDVFTTCKSIWITRKWYQFWLPKTVVDYTVIVPEETK